MPLIHTFTEQNYTVALWQITELETELLAMNSFSTAEIKKINSIGNSEKRLQSIASAVLVKKIVAGAEIYYDVNGKPHIKDSMIHISMSHTKNIAACIVHKKNVCGIDIEYPERDIMKIAHKFLSSKESNHVDGSNEKNELLFTLWCSKEAIYKANAIKEVSFKNDIYIDPQFKKSNSSSGYYQKGNMVKRFYLYKKKIADLIIIFAIETE